MKINKTVTKIRWMDKRLLAPVALAAIAAWWWLGAAEPEGVVSVRRGAVVQAVYATGRVEPTVWAELSPSKTARVEAILKDEGQPVIKGDRVVQMQDAVEAAQEAELNARLAYWQAETNRLGRLRKEGVSSLKALQEAEREVQALAAQLEALNQQRQQLSLVSPLDGVVLRREAEPGEMVDAKDAVLTVGRPDMLRVTAEVDEESIPLVAVGQRALIKADAFPDKLVEGRVSEITPLGDPRAKVFRARVALPDGSGLMPGMSVEVNIIARELEQALLVPATAVVGGGC